MGRCRPPIAFLRRRQKSIALFLFAVLLTIYGLFQTDGINSTRESDRSWRRQWWTAEDDQEGVAFPDSDLDGGRDDGQPMPAPAGKCLQKYPRECVTEFNTFDIYANSIAGGGQSKSSSKPVARSKRSNDKLRVFFLPMTHPDPGWLRTFESYTNDTNNILDNMLSFMHDHPKMRFLWCEMVFFERWWRNLNETSKNELRRLISTSQLEIASGSWVMTDEANPYFAVTVDNIVEGQLFTLNELGTKAQTMWSNDPFGYGQSVPYLFAKSGVRHAVLNRVHHGVKNYLQALRAVPFKWRQYFDEKGENDVYTHMLPYAHYDMLNSCGPQQSVCCEFDFKRMTHFACPGPKPVPITKENVKQKATALENQLKLLSNLYESNTLLVMWGDDFRYDMIEEWYQQYDNLSPVFDEINSRDSIEISFGTFKDYFSSLEEFYEKEKVQPPTLSGDFFPYQCALGDHWTGYYTTRPFFKRQERQLHSFVRAADLVTSSVAHLLSPQESERMRNVLSDARRNLLLFQHHDAITGTSKKHVMSDYSHLLFTSLRGAISSIRDSLSLITKSTLEIDDVPMSYNQLSTRQLIEIDPGVTKSVVVFNSHPRVVMETITLRLSSPNVKVTEGVRVIQAQIEPFIDPLEARMTNHFLLVFHAYLQPLTTSVFTLTYDEKLAMTIRAEVGYVAYNAQGDPIIPHDAIPAYFKAREIQADAFRLKSSRVSSTHDSQTGLITSIETPSVGELEFWQTVAQYKGSYGGAYIMNNHGDPEVLPLNGLSRVTVRGPVRHVAYVYSEYFRQHYSVNEIKGEEGERLHIGMWVDIRQLKQSELVTRFSPDLDANLTTFFTDSIGLQLVKREHHRQLPTKANYYPSPTSVVLQDLTRRVSILSDLEHGAMKFGHTGAEIMLDRLLLHDDGKGLGQGEDSIPNDMLPVWIGFTIIFEKLAPDAHLPNYYAHHSLAAHVALQSLLYRPVLFITSGVLKFVSSPAVVSLPCDVQLLTIRYIPGDLAQRLMTLHRAGIDCGLTTTVSCSDTDLNQSLRKYLKLLGVIRVQRTNLSGVEKVGEESAIDTATFDVDPMDFASFLLTFS